MPFPRIVRDDQGACNAFSIAVYYSARLDANMGAKKKETIRKLSEHLAPFPVFEAPKEEGCLAKWQQICVDNGLLVPETVLTHTYYKFDNLKQFRSNHCTNDLIQNSRLLLYRNYF